MAECPDVKCKTDFEHRVTSLEGHTASHSRDLETLAKSLEELRTAVDKALRGMTKVQWAIIGACILFVVKEIGVLEVIKLWLNL